MTEGEEGELSDSVKKFLEKRRKCVTCGSRIRTSYRDEANYCHACFLERDDL